MQAPLHVPVLGSCLGLRGVEDRSAISGATNLGGKTVEAVRIQLLACCVMFLLTSWARASCPPLSPWSRWLRVHSLVSKPSMQA